MKKAFTMIELLMVILIVSILTAVIVPRIGSNKIREAGIQVLSHIRYTQHLAMIDDKYDSTSQFWYRQRWQIAFSTASTTESYYIFSDSPSNTGAYDGNPGANNTYTDVEVATNTLHKNLYLIGVPNGTFDGSETQRLSTDLDIGTKYGVFDVKMNGGTGSSATRVLFDSFGRPYRGTGASTAVNPLNSPVDFIATTPILIKLCTEACVGNPATANNGNELVIAIEPETGYAHIL